MRLVRQSGQHGRGMCQTRLHLAQQVVAGGIVGFAQGLRKRICVCRAMALKHQAAQAQQGRAVVAAMVYPRLKRI